MQADRSLKGIALFSKWGETRARPRPDPPYGQRPSTININNASTLRSSLCPLYSFSSPASPTTTPRAHSAAPAVILGAGPGGWPDLRLQVATRQDTRCPRQGGLAPADGVSHPTTRRPDLSVYPPAPTPDLHPRPPPPTSTPDPMMESVPRRLRRQVYPTSEPVPSNLAGTRHPPHATRHTPSAARLTVADQSVHQPGGSPATNRHHVADALRDPSPATGRQAPLPRAQEAQGETAADTATPPTHLRPGGRSLQTPQLPTLAHSPPTLAPVTTAVFVAARLPAGRHGSQK